MRYSSSQIVFQEIPTEISLAYQITGCPLKCAGCHSSDLWSSFSGQELTLESLDKDLEKYIEYISCVLFLGGEWDESGLEQLLNRIKSYDLKTALYTGLEMQQVGQPILNLLDYLKYGPYLAKFGPLTSPTTNQKLINLKTNENLNYYFLHGGDHDSTRY